LIFKLFLLFSVTSLIELSLLIWIGQYLGIAVTIGLVILTAVIGATMAKIEGIRIWSRLRQELRRGEMPGNSLIEGALIFAGGITFLTPGFLTDTLGILCLIPVTRRLFRDWVKGWFRRNFRNGGGYSFQVGFQSKTPSEEDPFEDDFPA